MANTSVVVERHIAAGQGPVWEAVTDLRGMERVLSGVSKVEVLTDGAFGVGTRWRETRKMFGKEATEEMWVTACAPPERYVVEAESHGTHYVSEWELLADGPSATTVRMTFSGAAVAGSGGVAGLLAKILGGVSARAVRKAIAKDLDDVASAVEGRRL
ncbi:SRPBCC family protein [Streptomyces sp. NPDC057301]|uniref:SRPBCC family protein n=1 Tax=Streptomyces sp. NPDC057301 TaxID=3346093 RepID=UPI00363218D6